MITWQRPHSTTHILLILSGMWAASQMQRVALAGYIGASSIMMDLGITAASTGFLAAVYFPVYGGMQIPSGILADQGYPRRNLLIGGFVMVAAGLAFAVAPSFETSLAARVVIGLSAGLLWLSSIKICALLPGGAYARRVSLVMVIGSIGSIISLAGMPVLLSVFSWRIVAVLVTLPSFAASLLLLAAKIPRQETRAPGIGLWKRSTAALAHVPRILGRLSYWPVFLPAMLWTGTQTSVLTWLPRYARDVLELPVAVVGILPALIPLGQLVGTSLLGYLYARYRQIGLPAFFSTCFIYALALIFLGSGRAADHGANCLYTVVVGMGLLNGSFFISLVWIGEIVEPEVLGTASGVSNALGFFPAFVLPWMMGVLMDAVDKPTSPAWQYSPEAYGAAFWAGALLLVASLVGALLIFLMLRTRSRNVAEFKGVEI